MKLSVTCICVPILTAKSDVSCKVWEGILNSDHLFAILFLTPCCNEEIKSLIMWDAFHPLGESLKISQVFFQTCKNRPCRIHSPSVVCSSDPCWPGSWLEHLKNKI